MKNVLVTGGSRGIGRAIVEHLIAQNYKVIFTYNSTLPKECNLAASAFKLDMTDTLQCEKFLQELTDKDLFPEILVNNAGITADAMFHKMTAHQFTSVINTNLVSLFNITQPVFTEMRAKGFGRIVNISSINAKKGQVGQANYCASKAGIQGFTKALALEGARFGVTVNSVSPGYVETDMVMKIREDIRNSLIKDIPAGRFGKPEEVARLVGFLIAEESEYITGANYDINGAMHLN
jgi:acetoacetyl-CoA reductase